METVQEEGPWSVYRIVHILLFPKYLQFCMPRVSTRIKNVSLEGKKIVVLVFKIFWNCANMRPCLGFGLRWRGLVCSVLHFCSCLPKGLSWE